MAPRDTFNGVGVGRKAGSEAGEAVRWGHYFSGATCWFRSMALHDQGQAEQPHPIDAEVTSAPHPSR